MKKIIGLLLFIFVSATAALAVGGVASDPSRSIYNARQLGLGGAAIGFSDDANGLFTNPSGLTGFEFPQMSATSRQVMLDSTAMTNINWALPTSLGTFGLGYIGLGVGGSLPTTRDPATGRIILDPSSEASSYSNSVLALAYCREIWPAGKLALGGNIKFYNQSITGGTSADKGQGTGIDLSATARPLSWLTVGAVLQNIIGGTVKWSSVNDNLGSTYKLGGKLHLLGSSTEAWRANSQQLFAGLDVGLSSGTLALANSLEYHLGFEYLPIKDVAIRTGYDQESSGSGLTFGVGFTNSAFRFDYAYFKKPSLLGDNPHYFTLSYIGDRVLSTAEKLKKKTAFIKISHPHDRYITAADSLTISAEAFIKYTIDKKSVWTVISLSDTFEVQEIYAYEPLKPLYLNGAELKQTGSFETTIPLRQGWNPFLFSGYGTPEIIGVTSPETPTASAEIRVLRYVPFSDTPADFWAIQPIALCTSLDLMKGYPDETFKPEKGISRAELISLIVRTLPVNLEPAPEASPFKDVSATHWALKYIAYGSSQKFVSGYPDGTFKPNKVLTRAEAVTILARFAEVTEEVGSAPPFPDLKEAFWANKYIEPAKKIGLLNYLSGKDFRANEHFTRAEACEVLTQVPNIRQKIDLFWQTGFISLNK